MGRLARLALAAAALTGFVVACSGKVESGPKDTTVTPGGECAEDGATAQAEDGCNTCMCASGRWACTKQTCEEECEVGENRDAGDGCNTCTCTESGWACTQKACAVEVCAPGETRGAGDGCNTCTCSEDGEWLCTRADCPEPECVDGQTRPSEDGCNMCTCVDGGWVCTDRACDGCPPPRRTDQACPAVEVVAKDPSTDICCAYGDPCQAPQGWEQFDSEIECQTSGPCIDGETRPAGDGCNTCTCFDGHWGCTLIACVPD